jgi:hypothetical protein
MFIRARHAGSLLNFSGQLFHIALAFLVADHRFTLRYRYGGKVHATRILVEPKNSSCEYVRQWVLPPGPIIGTAIAATYLQCFAGRLAVRLGALQRAVNLSY